jgi:hypothetical protein
VQDYGRQVLTEVMSRIKGVCYGKIMGHLTLVLVKLFWDDKEGYVYNTALDILLQVRSTSKSACPNAFVPDHRNAFSSVQLILFRLWSSEELLFNR